MWQRRCGWPSTQPGCRRWLTRTGARPGTQPPTVGRAGTASTPPWGLGGSKPERITSVVAAASVLPTLPPSLRQCGADLKPLAGWPHARLREGALRFAVTDSGPSNAEVVVLLHGFPQQPRGFKRLAERLNAAGLRTLVPSQRGYTPTARPTQR